MKRRLCIVTPDFVGPVANGGVGTACLGLAELLRDRGWSVDVLFASHLYESEDAAYWRAHYARQRIGFVSLPHADGPPLAFQGKPGKAPENAPIARAYAVYRALRQAHYDVIHFVDYFGLGYYCFMARACGLAFQDTPLVLTAHGPICWSRLSNAAPFNSASLLVQDALERGCIRLAETLVAPSQFMIDWLQREGVRSSSSTSVKIGNAVPGVTRRMAAGIHAGQAAAAGKELVFFSRIEPRKGLHLFLSALETLQAAGFFRSHDPCVTFVGRFPGSLPEIRTILGTRAQKWDFRWKVLEGLDTFGALSHLAANARLVVVPSLMDNAPCTVVEALLARLPLITTDVGGIPELVDPAAQESVLIPPRADVLARRIAECFASDTPPARPGVPWLNADEDRLAELHDRLLSGGGEESRRDAPPPARAMATDEPLVSVCLLHFNRPDHLRRAIDGVMTQRWRRWEVILADNGSTDPEARLLLDEIDGLDAPIRVLRLQGGLPVAQARNRAAALATGDIIKFHDDDNVSKPHELETFARAISAGSFDLLTCFLDFYADAAPPAWEHEALRRFLYLGDGGLSSLIFNTMGDTNLAIRRDCFERIGGFDDDGAVLPGEDWRFLAKAKQAGLRIGVIPDALVWYAHQQAVYSSNWRKKDGNTLRNLVIDRAMRERSLDDRILAAAAQTLLFSRQN